ncbi:MAG: hypothetical protein WCJ33_03425, partial [Pseudomonadota bacterium]
SKTRDILNKISDVTKRLATANKERDDEITEQQEMLKSLDERKDELMDTIKKRQNELMDTIKEGHIKNSFYERLKEIIKIVKMAKSFAEIDEMGKSFAEFAGKCRKRTDERNDKLKKNCDEMKSICDEMKSLNKTIDEMKKIDEKAH